MLFSKLRKCEVEKIINVPLMIPGCLCIFMETKSPRQAGIDSQSNPMLHSLTEDLYYILSPSNMVFKNKIDCEYYAKLQFFF
jgi:hypothetical protein